MRSLEIRTTWDGRPVGRGERVHLKLDDDGDRWIVRVDAPFHGDPAPSSPPGRCDRLWEFEVVELFLVGPGERYLELEFGPAGHHLGLALDGIRRVVDAQVPVTYSSTRRGDRWYGLATVSCASVPRPVKKWNAFAIHGTGDRRRHLVAAPLAGGEEPDFHRIDQFPDY